MASGEPRGQVGVESAPGRPRCAAEVASGSPGDDIFDRLRDLPCSAWQLQRSRRTKVVLDSGPATIRSTLVLIANVPTHVGKRQLRFFFGGLAPLIRDVWLLRDGAPHRYGALLNVCCTQHADLLRRRLHGLRFSTVDVEVAIALPLSSVRYAVGVCPLASAQPSAGADAHAAESASAKRELLSTPPNPWQPLPAWQALPTCAVCLTRLEPSISGAVTRACTHASNCMCLSQGFSAGCRVCAAVEDARRAAALGGNGCGDGSGDGSGEGGGALAAAGTAGALGPASTCDPTPPTASPGTAAARGGRGAPPVACSECGETRLLWLCLVCGTTGCGRYASMHAHAHFVRTGHSLALDLCTQRVWDYEGDRFVHRLMAMGGMGGMGGDGGDGGDEDNLGFELELPDEELAGLHEPGGQSGGLGGGATAGAAGAGAPSRAESGAKLERVLREYSLLLTGQLEAQRTYWEEQLAAQAEQTATDLRAARDGLADVLSEIRSGERDAVRASRALSRREVSAARRQEELRAEQRFTQDLNAQLIANSRELRARVAAEREAVAAAELALEASRRQLDAALAQLSAEPSAPTGGGGVAAGAPAQASSC